MNEMKGIFCLLSCPFNNKQKCLSIRKAEFVCCKVWMHTRIDETHPAAAFRFHLSGHLLTQGNQTRWTGGRKCPRNSKPTHLVDMDPHKKWSLDKTYLSCFISTQIDLSSYCSYLSWPLKRTGRHMLYGTWKYTYCWNSWFCYYFF